MSNLNEKGVKTVVLGPGGSDTEIKDAFEGKCKVREYTKSVRCQGGFLIQIVVGLVVLHPTGSKILRFWYVTTSYPTFFFCYTYQYIVDILSSK